MRVKLFTFRYSSTLGGFDDSPLAEFIRDKEVLSCREHFFLQNDVPHFTCFLAYQEPVIDATTVPAAHEAGPPGERPRGCMNSRPRSEAPATLDERDRALWATLREWRSRTAREEGVPPYVILTNRELTGVVVKKPESPTALGHVPGIGPGKVKRYGQAILAALHGSAPDAEPSAPAAHGGPEARP